MEFFSPSEKLVENIILMKHFQMTQIIYFR